MTQTTKVLKEIASSEDYKVLAGAAEKVDYEAMFDPYMRISQLLREGRATIEKSIENLPVQNKEGQREKFQRAFEQATERILPVWYQLNRRVNSGLTKTKVMEGEVFGFGKKGDPLVRVIEGAIVVLPGMKLEQGQHVRFRVVQESGKLSFGRVFDLNSQSFYLLMTQEIRDRVNESLAWIRDRLSTFQGRWDGDSRVELGELLQRLRDIKETSSNLRAEESRRIATQVADCRKQLLYNASMGLMFDFISEQEERDIEKFYQDGHEDKSRALAALGLFRRKSYETAREKFLLKEEPEGYAHILSEMGDGLDSMDSAMELMGLQAAVDEIYPKAKGYFERMDRLFDNLINRLKQVVDTLSKKDILDPEEIRLAIEEAFSERVIFLELRRVFRSSKEFLSSRSAFLELNRRLRNEEVVAVETAFKPYLHHKVLQAFGPEGSTK
ncbi:MAG: hypothetical protein FJ012_01880 [Chloroflexi bacterium]|nr:hypothetical protein [Chloroflexota bacterium]